MSDTIYALSTGAPPAGIAIIRISGAEAATVADRLAHMRPRPRHATLATLRDPADQSFLDNGLLLFFPGPNSVTGEDLLELHLHGGRAVVRAVEACLARMAGLRAAEAGEFTRRAFINGRIHLNEAEGLADLLSAETEAQRRAASPMFAGVFTRKLEMLREALLHAAALVEADLDFSDEDDVGEGQGKAIRAHIQTVSEEVARLLAMPSAEHLRSGFSVVLAGPPNSGKSTLLNALVQREAAIVSDIAGTTRDVISVPVSLSGLPFLFSDTAGLRERTEDVIEQIGMARAEEMIAAADMLLWLGPEGEGPDHPRRVEVDAKCDVADRPVKSAGALCLSARTGQGMDGLITHLVDAARDMVPPVDGFALNNRQRDALAAMASDLDEASHCEDMVIVGELLRMVRERLDLLVGRAGTEDLLDALFGRFCIGK